jgi:Putative adhesin
MLTQVWLALSIGIAVFALSSNAKAEEWTKSWSVGGKPDVRLDTQDASITVEPGPDHEITAYVKTRGYSIGNGGVRIVDHQDGNRVELEIREPATHFSFGVHSVELRVRVPRDLLADIHTGDGSIKLSGLRGSLRLNTGDGSIQGDDLDGAVDAHSGDGSVGIRGRFDNLQVRTSDGSVDVRAEPGSRMSSDWRIESGDGSVRLGVPQDLAADVSLRTGDGSIHLDLPLTVNSLRSEHEIRGKLNGGGPTLDVHTGDGSISVGRR